MRRPTYHDAISWIGDNDEDGSTCADDMLGLISVALVADLFGVAEERVAADVLRHRASEEATR